MSKKEKILDMAGNLTPEETAEVAGELLEMAGVSRENCIAFLKALSEDSRDELTGRLENLPDEVNG